MAVPFRKALALTAWRVFKRRLHSVVHCKQLRVSGKHFRSTRTFALLLVLGFGLSIMMSACTGGNANSSNATAPNGSSASSAIRIGYQVYGTLNIVRAKGDLEKRLQSQGISVKWNRFPGGPQLLEALNAGSLDYGHTGETPPIFAQAAGAPLVYIANELPSPNSEAILVAKDSPIQKVADLKGKKVALNKGSNVHYLLVRALEAAGLKYSDIQPVYLPPADARGAFERGSVDAWVIWDPYFGAAQKSLGARVLRDGEGLVANREFYLAAKPFAEQHPEHIKVILEETQKVDEWAKRNPDQVATLLAPQLNVDVPTLSKVSQRRNYGTQPIQPDVVAYQQQIADTFFKLKLVPKQLDVKEVAEVPQK